MKTAFKRLWLLVTVIPAIMAVRILAIPVMFIAGIYATAKGELDFLPSKWWEGIDLCDLVE